MKIKVEFEIELPVVDGVQPTDDEIEEWLRYELNDNGGMELANPLSGEQVEPIFGTFQWEPVRNYHEEYSR